jgi:hypothetical protein
MCPPSVAAERASLLVRQYPERSVSDPQVFIAGLCAVFIRYPEMIVRRVTAPGTGLASKVEFLSQAAVEKACESEYAPFLREDQRRKAYAETAKYIEAPKVERPSIEEIKAKLGPDYGIERTGARPKEPGKTLAELKAEAANWDLEISPELISNIAEKSQQNGETR